MLAVASEQQRRRCSDDGSSSNERVERRGRSAAEEAGPVRNGDAKLVHRRTTTEHGMAGQLR